MPDQNIECSKMEFDYAVQCYSHPRVSSSDWGHELHFTHDGSYVAQFQPNMIDDGPDFYWFSAWVFECFNNNCEPRVYDSSAWTGR